MPISVLEYVHLTKMPISAFSSNAEMNVLKSVNYFYMNMKDAQLSILFLILLDIAEEIDKH